MKHLANQMGNIDDIKCSIKHNKHSLADLEAALLDEKSRPQPRQTVIKLLESNIKKALSTISR